MLLRLRCSLEEMREMLDGLNFNLNMGGADERPAGRTGNREAAATGDRKRDHHRQRPGGLVGRDLHRARQPAPAADHGQRAGRTDRADDRGGELPGLRADSGSRAGRADAEAGRAVRDRGADRLRDRNRRERPALHRADGVGSRVQDQGHYCGHGRVAPPDGRARRGPADRAAASATARPATASSSATRTWSWSAAATARCRKRCS